MPPLILMSLLMVFTNTTHAAVYKCQTANDQIVYTDTPCEAGNKEIAMEVISPSAQGIDTASKASIMRQLDAAVKSAIAANEMTRARALATTTEHKEWIAAAMKENARQTFKSPAELREKKHHRPNVLRQNASWKQKLTPSSVTLQCLMQKRV